MTVECEEPALLAATCDGCGDRRVLDIDQEAEPLEICQALEALGWERRTPERHRFGSGSYSAGFTAVFEQDFCADCQSDEPRPHPTFRPGPGRPHHKIDAFANDPCDEWPRALVFGMLGLRPDCGHPRGEAMCPFCEIGCPIGSTSQWWQRR